MTRKGVGTADQAGIGLWDYEELGSAQGFPVLSYLRVRDTSQPTIVFLPGGGHLGRIAYGHPDGNRRDFLDYWLGQSERSMLALSYPSDHPVFRTRHSGMTVTDWAVVVAERARKGVEAVGLSPEITVLGWSMGGRAAGAITPALAQVDLTVRCFISLAGTPPLAGILPVHPAIEPRTPDGLWDVLGEPSLPSRFVTLWNQELDSQEAREQRTIIPRDVYRSDYLCNTPSGLLGTTDVPKQSRGDNGGFAEVEQWGFEQYPAVAAMIPTDQIDPRHALSDQATWGFVATQRVVARYGVEVGRQEHVLSEGSWSALRSVTQSLPQRISRFVRGGHLFFVGEQGAREAVDCILELEKTAEEVEEEIDSLLIGQP